MAKFSGHEKSKYYHDGPARCFLLGLFAFPLWNIMLGAPQYPEPLGMNIHITGIQGVSEFDLQNIDGLNHYIGMKTISETR